MAPSVMQRGRPGEGCVQSLHFSLFHRIRLLHRGPPLWQDQLVTDHRPGHLAPPPHPSDLYHRNKLPFTPVPHEASKSLPLHGQLHLIPAWVPQMPSPGHA